MRLFSEPKKRELKKEHADKANPLTIQIYSSWLVSHTELRQNCLSRIFIKYI